MWPTLECVEARDGTWKVGEETDGQGCSGVGFECKKSEWLKLLGPGALGVWEGHISVMYAERGFGLLAGSTIHDIVFLGQDDAISLQPH